MRLLAHDLRDATRTLRKEPRFLLITSLTLALGIAAATSIFSVVNGVLLKPLPYPNADRLVNVWSAAPGLDFPQFPLSPDLYLFFKKHNAVFEDMALVQNRRANITESGPPEAIDASVATHSYFTTLGIAFAARARLRSARRPPRRTPRRRDQPPAVDAAVRRRPGIGRTHNPDRWRPNGGRRRRARMARSGRVARCVAAGAVQPGEPAGRHLRLERDRAAEAWRAARPGRDAPGPPGAARDGAGAKRSIPRLPPRRRLSTPRPPDAGGSCRQPARAAVDPAGDRRGRAAHRVRQRREPVPRSRRRAPAGDGRPHRAGRQPRQPSHASCSPKRW